MKTVKALGRFWYDFIIGEDWKIAASVTSALVVLVALMKADLLGGDSLTVLGGVLIILFFTASLVIDVQPRRRRRARGQPAVAEPIRPPAQTFLLQRVQPAMTGLIDGSLSTLAPILSVAVATHHPHTAFIAGLATALGAGVSMAFSEGLSDTGTVTGRGNPYLRGAITGLGTFLGGILHTLPFLIGQYRTALGVAVVVIAFELVALALLRWRFFATRFLYSFASILLGGAIIAGLSALLGAA